MKHIRAYQKRLDELYAMPIRGNDNDNIKDCSQKSYIIKIPTEEFDYFEGICLPTSIILGSILERGLLLKEKKYASLAKILSKIRSKNQDFRRKACQRLYKEYEKVLKKLPHFREIENFTLENTCHNLAMFFEVNIVVHELKFGKDFIDHIQSPNAKEYDPGFPRVDILITRNGDLYSGHADLISPRYSNIT